MSQHHPLGPSTLQRRAACPGSYHAELPLWDTPEESSEDAIAGTKRHEAANAGLMDYAKRVEILAHLTKEDADIVQAWWDYWDAKIQSACIVTGAGSEVAVTLDGDRFGTCDGWMLWRDSSNNRILTVADLKGQQPCRASKSLQLLDYAIGIIVSNKISIDGLTVQVAFVSRQGVDEWEQDGQYFMSLIDYIRSVIAFAKSEDAPRIPGDHCAYCRASATCEERRDVAVRAASLVAVLADPVRFVASLTPDQRTQTLDNLDLAADKLAEAVTAIKAKIKDGSLEVPGYRVINSTRSDWKNEEEARLRLQAIAQERGIRFEDLTPLVSTSKASALLGKGIVEPLTERKPGSSSVRRMKGEP